MFTSTSLPVLKSFGCRRISLVIFQKIVQKYSTACVIKGNESHLLSQHSSKCLLGLRWLLAFKSARLHNLPKHQAYGLVNISKNFLMPRCSYQTKSKDFNKEDDDNSESEKSKNVLDDLEFQSLLKDFAHDFGVNEESDKELEEIKRQHGSFDGTNDLPDKSTQPDHHLDFHNTLDYKVENETEPRTTNSFLDEHKSQEPSSYKYGQQFEETQDDADEFFHIDQELEEPTKYDATRGTEGVYDIGELVTVLRGENLVDISVVQIPQSLHYADYLVLATAKSPRHCQAVVEFVMKHYKQKKNKEDPFLKCEGKTTTSWKALDMGNIVLHVFLEDTRNFYDIESFWVLDKKYDNISTVKSDPQLDVMQQHMNFFNNFIPQ